MPAPGRATWPAWRSCTPISSRWRSKGVLEGYAEPVDPALVVFYTVHHLVQLGFHSASLGHDVHAATVADAARAAVAAVPQFWRGDTAALLRHTSAGDTAAHPAPPSTARQRADGKPSC